jgi:hypothetical protein
MKSFVAYDHEARTHLSHDKDAPDSLPGSPCAACFS